MREEGGGKVLGELPDALLKRLDLVGSRNGQNLRVRLPLQLQGIRIDSRQGCPKRIEALLRVPGVLAHIAQERICQNVCAKNLWPPALLAL